MAATSVSQARSAKTRIKAFKYQLPVCVLRNERNPTTITSNHSTIITTYFNAHTSTLTATKFNEYLGRRRSNYVGNLDHDYESRIPVKC